MIAGENKGANAIWCAAYGGKVESIELLMLWNVTLHKCSDDGRTPIDIAMAKNHHHVQEYLEKH